MNYRDSIKRVVVATDDDAERIETLMRASAGTLDGMTLRKFNALARKMGRLLMNARDKAVEVEFEVRRRVADRFSPWSACKDPLIFEASVSSLFGDDYFVRLKGDREAIRDLAVAQLGYDPGDARQVIEDQTT